MSLRPSQLQRDLCLRRHCRLDLLRVRDSYRDHVISPLAELCRCEGVVQAVLPANTKQSAQFSNIDTHTSTDHVSCFARTCALLRFRFRGSRFAFVLLV